MPAVQLQGVRVEAAGRTLLHVSGLTIGTGERVAVVGPNGAGKSTLLGVIGSLRPAQRGDMQVLGRKLGACVAAGAGREQRRTLRREVGLLSQGLHLVPRLTARENVLVGALARLRGAEVWRSWLRWYPRSLVAEAEQALDALGLAAQAGTRADRLSGGERQKVGVARLQLQRPRLVLADEPTSALDPAGTALVVAALRALVAEPGRTLVTVVHDLELLPLLATRVVGMADGRVQWDQPTAQVTPAMLQALYAPRPGEAPAAAEHRDRPMRCLARA